MNKLKSFIPLINVSNIIVFSSGILTCHLFNRYKTHKIINNTEDVLDRVYKNCDNRYPITMIYRNAFNIEVPYQYGYP